MRIGVDGYNIGLPHGTGIASYARSFIGTARAAGHAVDLLMGERFRPQRVPLLDDVQFSERRVAHGKPVRGIAKRWFGSLRAVTGNPVIPIQRSGQVQFEDSFLPEVDQLWNSPSLFVRAVGAYRTLGLKSKIVIPGIDMMHWTYPVPIATSNCQNVYTIHDLIPLKLPYTTLDDKKYFYNLCKSVVDRADHIITVSECSRRDIIEMLGADPERVTNTYQACDLPPSPSEMQRDGERDLIKGLFDLEPQGYFLFFGALEPKKNVGRLVEAYKASLSSTPLIIVGAPGWMNDKERAMLDAMADTPMARQILRLDYLPRHSLLSLVSNAKAVIFPSLYEGFGLPMVEAMSLGTPVIASNAGSLPEVAGDAALLVDPYDVGSIRDAIRAMDARSDLRSDLIARGSSRVAMFSRDAYTERLNRLFDRLQVQRKGRANRG